MDGALVGHRIDGVFVVNRQAAGGGKITWKAVSRPAGPLAQPEDPVELEDDCPICFEPLGQDVAGEVVVTGCRHTFHKRCLAEWDEKGTDSCPVCRYRFYIGEVGWWFAAATAAATNAHEPPEDGGYNLYGNDGGTREDAPRRETGADLCGPTD